MRTAAGARGRGVATLMVRHILDEAWAQNLERLYLDTGTEDYFAPAHHSSSTAGPPEDSHTARP